MNTPTPKQIEVALHVEGELMETVANWTREGADVQEILAALAKRRPTPSSPFMAPSTSRPGSSEWRLPPLSYPTPSVDFGHQLRYAGHIRNE